MPKRLGTIAATLLLAACAGTCLAIEQETDEDRALAWGVGVRMLYDSNIYDASSDEIASWIAVVKPAIAFSTAPAPRRFGIRYEGEYGRFFEDSTDNYADHLVGAAAAFQFGSRGLLELSGVTEKEHFDRGTEQTDGFGPGSPFFPVEPDRLDRSNWEARFRYGADGNRGRLHFAVGGNRLEYQNNRARTGFFDYSSLFGSAGLSLLFHQRTAIVFDAVYTDIQFAESIPGDPSRDGQDVRLLLGVKWEATGKTSGSVRAGVQHRRLDDPAREATTNPSWEVDVRWSPRSHSHIDLATSRLNQETFGPGAFIDRLAYSVSWTHQWRRDVQTVTRWTKSDFRFVDAQRDQVATEIFLGLSVPQGRLLSWEIGHVWRQRDSNLSRLIYDGNMFFVGVNVAD